LSWSGISKSGYGFCGSIPRHQRPEHPPRCHRSG